MKYIVYKTINLVNNKIYIGVHKTEDPETFDGYLGCGVYAHNSGTYNKPKTAFQFAVKKYGTANFKRAVLKIFDCKEDAYNLEAILVDEQFINRKDTYNMCVGGINAPTNNISIYQFSTEGKLLKQWESVQEASMFYKVSHTAIINAINFKGSCKGYFWSRTNKINYKEHTLYKGTTCYKYNKQGKLIEVYNSMLEASKCNNVTIQEIQRVVKGGYELKNFYYSTKLYETFEAPAKTQLKNNYLYVYDLEGNFITKLLGIKNICKFFNIKSNCVIYTAIRCKRPYKKFQLSLEYKDKLEPVASKTNKPKIVECYDSIGNLIETFQSVTKAQEKYGAGVIKVLQGKRQMCKGRIFKYK